MNDTTRNRKKLSPRALLAAVRKAGMTPTSMTVTADSGKLDFGKHEEDTQKNDLDKWMEKHAN
jgi:hypothetical protein